MITANNLQGISYIKYGFLNAEESDTFRETETALYLKQVHDSDVIFATSLDIGQDVECDGCAAVEEHLKLVIKTADCVPVLLADTKKKIIGACHAGWKGALKGVVKNTVEAMRRLGSNTEDIAVAIGPAIQMHSYEVKSDFYDAFAQYDEPALAFFCKHRKHFNLPGYVRSKLEREGVTNVCDCGINTFEDESFYSWRRDKKIGEKRNISFIEIV
jgi:YfiH family protein